jgi:hypothetical protein
LDAVWDLMMVHWWEAYLGILWAVQMEASAAATMELLLVDLLGLMVSTTVFRMELMMVLKRDYDTVD